MIAMTSITTNYHYHHIVTNSCYIDTCHYFIPLLHTTYAKLSIILNVQTYNILHTVSTILLPQYCSQFWWTTPSWIQLLLVLQWLLILLLPLPLTLLLRFLIWLLVLLIYYYCQIVTTTSWNIVVVTLLELSTITITIITVPIAMWLPSAFDSILRLLPLSITTTLLLLPLNWYYYHYVVPLLPQLYFCYRQHFQQAQPLQRPSFEQGVCGNGATKNGTSPWKMMEWNKSTLLAENWCKHQCYIWVWRDSTITYGGQFWISGWKTDETLGLESQHFWGTYVFHQKWWKNDLTMPHAFNWDHFVS